MKRTLALALLAGALALPTVACRSPHLGADTGNAYRDALASQRDGDGAQVDDISAEDARTVLRAHGAAGQRSSRGSARTRSTSSSSSSPAPMDLGGRWEGASGNIQLNAK